MYRLFDSSVWIDHKKNRLSGQAEQLRQDLLLNKVCICPVIIQEVLQGVRSDRESDDLIDAFKGIRTLNWDATEAAISAATLYRQLRQKGITVRKPNDCLIASFALYFNAELCHNDRDFDQIAAHTGLKVWQG